ncbi:MAG: TIGR02757 family protein [Bacteroidia bacterium]|nr:TIGR02757 family protein [Bacteroidia bacterium]
MHILQKDLKDFLDRKADFYNKTSFIDNDPIIVPHRFSLKQDIEIMGFFAATFAWGQRKTIIQKSMELAKRFDGKPHEFILNHAESDLKQLLGFKHRTFNDTDLLYFVDFLHRHYKENESLEDAFIPKTGFADMERSLIYFEQYFFNHSHAPARTRKHVATPARNSTCKRLNMFLRWMVRDDGRGVDFGLWKKISPKALICPIDVHVERTARNLRLISRPQTDWKTAVELTENLRLLDADDPVKYDFALFGLSIEKEMYDL